MFEWYRHHTMPVRKKFSKAVDKSDSFLGDGKVAV
jgi:hypothetical protein